jgi:hypothetical protein
MSSTGPISPQAPLRSVFLSYASEDRNAAQTLRDALPALGLDVWYDESDLTGGDAWDQKIRRQIRECDFFMPLISAQTEARHEGYFRREWRLAVERSLDMADDHTFILPVAIDDTPQAGARVPEKFFAVQWSRLPAGQPTPAFEALCRRLAAGETKAPQSARRASHQFPRTGPAASAADAMASGAQGATISAALDPTVSLGQGSAAYTAQGRTGSAASASEFPEFPLEEPGQKTRFWFRVVGWALQWAWVAFNRLPRWLRYIVYVWLIIAVIAKSCSTGRVEDSSDRPRHSHSDKLSAATTRKLQQIADDYQGSSKQADIPKLAAQVAKAFADEGADESKVGSPLLAIPFGAPAGDAAAQKLADSTFALVYGRVAVSHHGHVGLAEEPLPSLDPQVALERGRTNKSAYVLYGAVDNHSGVQELTVKLLTVEDGEVTWSKFYPVAGADATKIAEEVDSKVPRLEED